MKKEWFKEWFESNDYLYVYNHRDDKEALTLIELIIKTINPSKEKIFLDAACGFGRHALVLSSLGYKVVGFDLSRNLLSIAKRKSIDKNLNLDLLVADFRSILFKKKIDVVMNLFTSFGYFETDEDNFHFVKRAHHFMNKGGYYVLDYINLPYLEKNIVRETERVIGGKIIREFRSIENDRVNKKILIRDGNTLVEYNESVKLYNQEFLIKNFRYAGFNLIKQYGDYLGNDFDEQESPRLVLFFQK